MAREVQRFAVTIPPGTAPAAPLTVPINFPPREVVELEIIVPPGPRGVMGFQIAQAGQQVFPYTPGQFIVTDDEQIKWAIEGANTSGAWQVIGYNTGAFPHTIEVRFLVNLPELAGPPLSPAIINPEAISSPELALPGLPALELPPPPPLPPPPGL